MRIQGIKSKEVNFGAVIDMLVKHFNYSIRDINSYDEFTDEEKRIIDKDLFNKITADQLDDEDTYTPITWPDIQYYMDQEGFGENSYLINDDQGMDDFGSSAYMVNVNWINSLNK